MKGMPPLVVAVIAATLVLLVGTSLVQATTTDPRGSPVASADNGAPRGLLLLKLALERAGVRVVVAETAAAFDAAVVDPRRTLIVVPPPEKSAWSSGEAGALRGLLRAGARVVVGCDGHPARRKRVQPLLQDTGALCIGGAPTEAAVATVDADIAGAQRFTVLDRGRVGLNETTAGLLPWTIADDTNRVLVASAIVDDGELVVLGSMSVLANDGLPQTDNAVLLRRLREGKNVVVIDERHHETRLDAVVNRARLQGPGPLTALVCALLLLPLSLLSWLPRRGVLLDGDDVAAAPGVADRVAGLAALLGRTTTPTTTTTTTMTATTTESAASSPSKTPGAAP